jgi:hypothetical protein
MTAEDVSVLLRLPGRILPEPEPATIFGEGQVSGLRA